MESANFFSYNLLGNLPCLIFILSNSPEYKNIMKVFGLEASPFNKNIGNMTQQFDLKGCN